MAKIFHDFLFLSVIGTAACGQPARLPPDASTVIATPAQLAEGTALPGSYLVSFRTDAGGPGGSGFANFAAEHRAHFSSLHEQYLADPRIKDLRFLAAVDLAAPGRRDLGEAKPAGAAAPLQRLAWSQNPQPRLTGSLAQVDFRSPADAEAALAAWESRGAIWFAEPNYVSRLSAEGNQFETYAKEYGELNYWWLSSINLPQAFATIAGRDQSEAAGGLSDETIQRQRPIVAVLDSGVDYEHPALKERIWVNKDLNASGCTNDLHGCNTTTAKRGRLGNGDVWPYDTDGPNNSCEGKDPNCSHGTHVAGVVAADHSWFDPQSGSPAAGVCPVCQIMIVKIVSKVGKESGILDSSIIAALKYVTLFKREGSPAVRIVNASFGKFVRSRSVALLVRDMRASSGAILIGAAGNEDTLSMEYPAAFSDAIAVSAVDSDVKKVSFSNYGRWVDISAPGKEIVSTVPGGGIAAKSGTSMAAPMVAGVAGLMLARYPGLSFAELRASLLRSSDPSFYGKTFLDGYNYTYYYPKIKGSSLRQPLLGFGVLDASKAINREASNNLPVYADNNRVRPGCGVVGISHLGRSPVWWLLLALPLALAMRPQAQPSAKPPKNQAGLT